MLNKIKTILWDFDGVILDSISIRDAGYWHVLSDFPDDQVEKLLKFQQINGGLSRYVKFRYFYEDILDKEITNEEVIHLADKYSKYMVQRLTDPGLLIDETLNFILSNKNSFNMHIVSGSDQDELQFLCKKLQIDHLFETIHGSPTPKIELVRNILAENNYDPKYVILIGDSVNDYDAANINNIRFYGYNNRSLSEKGEGYITTFSEFVSD